MMKRWMGLVSDSDGLDAVIQLSDDPDGALAAAKELKSVPKEKKEQRGSIRFALDHGKIPDRYDLRQIVQDYEQEATKGITQQFGGAAMGEYMAYELRKRYANGNLMEVSWIATVPEVKKIRNQNPYQGAIDVLNLVLSGKGKTVRERDTDEDVQDYIDIMEMKLKAANRRNNEK